MDSKGIAFRIKEALGLKKDSGISDELGVSKQVVSNCKNNRANWSLPLLLKLCQKHDIAFGWLIDGEGDPQVTPAQSAYLKNNPVTVERLMKIANVAHENDLSPLLGTYIQNIRNYQADGHCPIDKVYQFSQNTSLPINSILYEPNVRFDLQQQEAVSLMGTNEWDFQSNETDAALVMETEPVAYLPQNELLQFLKEEVAELRASNKQMEEMILNLQKTIAWQMDRNNRLEEKARKYEAILAEKAQKYDAMQQNTEDGSR